MSLSSEKWFLRLLICLTTSATERLPSKHCLTSLSMSFCGALLTRRVLVTSVNQKCASSRDGGDLKRSQFQTNQSSGRFLRASRKRATPLPTSNGAESCCGLGSGWRGRHVAHSQSRGSRSMRRVTASADGEGAALVSSGAGAVFTVFLPLAGAAAAATDGVTVAVPPTAT